MPSMQQSLALAALVDTRTNDGRKFIEGLPPSVVRFELKGDISRTWYGGLEAWMNAPGPKRLVGFSSDADYFMIGQLCRPLRMHIAKIAEHDSRRRKVMTHRVAVPGQQGLAEGLISAAGDWPKTMSAFACAGAEPAAKDDALQVIETSASRSQDFPGYLLTWVVQKGADRKDKAG